MIRPKIKFLGLTLAVIAVALLGTTIGASSAAPAFAQAAWETQLNAHVNPQVSTGPSGNSIQVSWTPVNDDTPAPPAAGGRLPSRIAIIRSSEVDGETTIINFRHIAGSQSQTVVDGGVNKVDVYTYKVKLIYQDDNGNELVTHEIGTTPETYSIGTQWNQQILLDALNPVSFPRSGHQGIRVRWTDTKKSNAHPPAADGARPSKYQVLRTPDAGFDGPGEVTRDHINLYFSNGTVKYNDPSAYPGETYTYSIKVFYPNGHTETVQLGNSTKLHPRMFLNQTAVRGSDDSITVTWDGAFWGPTEYQVRRIKIGTRSNGKRYIAERKDIGTVTHVNINQHTYTDTTADANAEYYYQIRAVTPPGKTARTRWAQVTDAVQ